jgi:hypothetical protein
MAISRYRNTESLRGKLSFKLDKKTRRPLELVFLDGQKYHTLSPEALDEIEVIQFAYKRTDTLMGLAQKYYQDASYWWVIALINNIGSEADLQEGNNITIITPVDTFISEIGL